MGILNEQGIYELEIYCVPNPFDEIDNDNYIDYKTVSALRYTVKVE